MRTSAGGRSASTSARPLISIITPVLQGGATIETAIQSVLNQRFDSIEFLIIDGGSGDETLPILEKYNDRIALWVSEPDEGIYDAMNKGLELATGEWIYFLGADDQLLEGFSEVPNYLKDSSTIYYGDVYRPKLKRLYDGPFSAYKIAARNICHQCIFYPRCVWDKYRYDLDYPVFADYELNLKCFVDASFRFEYIPVTVATFQDGIGMSSSAGDESFDKHRLRFLKENFPSYIFLAIYLRTLAIRVLKRLGLFDAILRAKRSSELYLANMRSSANPSRK